MALPDLPTCPHKSIDAKILCSAKSGHFNSPAAVTTD
jgi:hypothetical protein